MLSSRSGSLPRTALLAGLVSTLFAPSAAADVTLDEVRDAFGLESAQLLSLTLDVTPETDVLLTLPLGDELHTIMLTPRSNRSPDYKLMVQDESGLHEAEPGPINTWRGQVAGDPFARVAAGWTDDGLTARVILGDEREFWLEPAATSIDRATPDDYIVYTTEDVIPSGGMCAADAVIGRAIPGTSHESGSFSGAPACGTGLCIAELGCDADFEYFSLFGTVGGTENQINSIINAVNLQYESEVGITHQIVGIVVRTTVNDPYTSSSLGGLLNQIDSVWGTIGIQHDIAELFTGRNLDGGVIGVAWLSAVCSGLRYSVVENVGGFSCKTDLSAHELGHNWGADHCTCSGWTMNPSLTCANRFNPTFTIPDIESFRDAISCLSPACVPGPGADCNNNGADDECDIASGASADFNGNGIPDDCESPVTLYVDDDTCPGLGAGTSGNPFCSIGDAIANAKSGDTIVVRAGTYTGADNRGIVFGGRELTLVGEDGAAATVVDGGLANETIFSIVDGESSSLVIEGLTVRGGDALNDGGGFRISNGSTPVIRNCIVRDNRAGVFGAGFSIKESAAPTIVNTLVVENIAGNGLIGAGGGMSIANASPVIQGCTVAANVVDGAFAATGGGLDIGDSAGTVITNTIVYGNVAALEPGIGVIAGDPTVTYCDVQGGFTGAGNIDADPLLVGGGDYSLQLGSPCIDAGDPGFVPLAGETDVDGDDRVIGAAVDIGADEFAGAATCQADLGFGGPGAITLEVCGDDLTSAGSSATLTIAGATPSSAVLLAIGAVNNPTPVGSGTLVPSPWLLLVTLPTNGSGGFVAPVSGGAGAPATIYLQVIDTNPSPLQFSNAVEAVIGT